MREADVIRVVREDEAGHRDVNHKFVKLIDEKKPEDINIEDKSLLHKNHVGNQEGKFHLKITIKSIYLKKISRIESNKKIYKILDKELKDYIHSIQILIS